MAKNVFLCRMARNRIPKEQALQKLKHYCAYQERCHKEVREKLYELGQWTDEVDEITAKLIEEGYLNEERFAIQFAGGRFRMKQWGRKKIAVALKEKQVSPYCVKKALKQIPEEDYMATLEKLAAGKWATLKSEKNIFTKMKKCSDYLLQKGYEYDLVREVIGNMRAPGA